jgi:hypothetical protein
MPSLETLLIISGALNAGALLREAVRAYTTLKNTKQQNDSTVVLADRQITASEKQELQGQVNKLMVEWQQVVIESKELEAQVGIQAYIIQDLTNKLAEYREKEQQKLLDKKSSSIK